MPIPPQYRQTSHGQCAISIVQMTFRRIVEATGTSHGTAYAEQFTTANSATSATPVQRICASPGR